MRPLGQRRQPKKKQAPALPGTFVLVRAMIGEPPPPVKQRRRRGRPWFLSALLFVVPGVFTFISITLCSSLFTSGWLHVARVTASLLRFAI